MRSAPDWFQRQLKQEHDGRLRIRWSPARLRWQIEQKVDTAKLPPFRIDPLDDDVVRAFDGYAPVCEVCPGTTSPCSNTSSDNKSACRHPLTVPVGKFTAIKCSKCKSEGRNGGQIVAFFELNDSLLVHLRTIDPSRGAYDRTREKLRNHNRQIMDGRAASISRELQAVARDDMRIDIPKVGYTGKVFT